MSIPVITSIRIGLLSLFLTLPPFLPTALPDQCDRCCHCYSPNRVPLPQEMWAWFINNSTSGVSLATAPSLRFLFKGSGGRVLFYGGYFANRQLRNSLHHVSLRTPTTLPIAYRTPLRLLSNILSKCHLTYS